LPEPQPTLEEWRSLYEAAQVFKEAALWEYTVEEQLFGVRDPESGQTHYCSITGLLGEHLALIVYLGEEGLGRYYDIVHQGKEARGYLQERDATMSVMETPQLQASFTDRDVLRDLDRAVAKQIGLRFRGQNAWPMFRHYIPGRHPWFVTAPQARFLRAALEQALIAIKELDEAPFLLDTAEASEDAVSLLIRSWDGKEWVSSWETVKPVPSAGYSAVDERPFTAARRALPLKPARLEAHLTLLLTGVVEGEWPPYFPYILLLVDGRSGMVLGQEMLLARPTLASALQEVPLRFLALLQGLGMRPHDVSVASERLYQLLALPCRHMGIRLSRRDSLPMLEEAFHTLEEWMSRSNF
jgi:hypothetical protein